MTWAVSPSVQATMSLHPHRHLLLLFSPKADTHFNVPRRVKGWVDLVGWLHRPTEMVYPPPRPTHPGTNRVWRSATTLIEANALPTKPNRQPDVVIVVDWLPRQFAGHKKVVYAQRMFRELLLYGIYLMLLGYGTFHIFSHIRIISFQKHHPYFIDNL